MAWLGEKFQSSGTFGLLSGPMTTERPGLGVRLGTSVPSISELIIPVNPRRPICPLTCWG